MLWWCNEDEQIQNKSQHTRVCIIELVTTRKVKRVKLKLFINARLYSANAKSEMY